MKLNKGWTLVLCLLVATLFIATTFAQETTAGMQGTVKDPQGAVVSNATVEVTSPSLIGVKKLDTDPSGYYRFANLPPGAYTITVSAKGFRTLKQTGLILEVGKLPTMDLVLQIGGTEQTIEVSSAAPIVDTAQSKVQTNITETVMGGIPKGRSFQSLINLAPGARYEPLQSDRSTGIAGYQIDGASSSENSYLVEGQETGDVRTGETKTNVPLEFIQEVQIKTSGFEAEYGGALGGVVNVIQKRGGNAWHGSVFGYYQGDFFNAAPNRYVRYDPQAGDDEDTRLSAPFQMYQPKKDKRRIVEPGFEVGGYLLKDRLWAFTSFVPRYDRLTRTVNWNSSQYLGPRDFYSNEETYYALSRLDYLATQKIRVYGAWQYGYDRNSGTALPNADDAYGLYNGSKTQNPDNFRTTIGNVQPNVIYNVGADITITPNLVATTRFGRTYNDYQDRGLLAGIRYRWIDSNYTSGYGYLGKSGVGVVGLDGTALPAAYQKSSAFSTMSLNLATQYDQLERRSFQQDMAYFKKGMFGTHNFKIGYAFNRMYNNVSEGYNTAQAYLAYGQEYTVLAANVPVCQAIIAQNLAHGWAAGGPSSGASCQGLWGTVNFRESGTIGEASSFNHSLYAQDAWTMGGGVTLNIGVRSDKENLPSFKAGVPGIGFNFQNKMAPRLGGSWDIFRNGKMKVYGSFGYFYDIMKYEMPRGSFGGDYWHDCVYALDVADYTTLIPTRAAGNHFCNPTGGANFAGGNAPAGLRFIENKDFRIPSNDPTDYRIDPNLKPMKQHEMVLGADYAVNSKLGLETRYSRKRLDRTIEDAGVMTAAGEAFYIVNPGEGIHLNGGIPAADCTNCPTQPKAKRAYDAVEFRLTKRATGNWFGSLSYTYSRLYGNYSGLTSTDVADASTGRSSPNVDRAFDEPWMQFDAHGKAIDGPLATDRPHTFKGYGYYRLKFGRHESMFGLSQNVYSGSPITTYYDTYGANQYPEGRGMFVPATRLADGTISYGTPYQKRTPMFTQSDFSFVHEFQVSKTNEAMRLGFEANVINLFNQRSALNIASILYAGYSLTPTAGIAPGADIDYNSLMKGFNWQAQSNDVAANTTILNSEYGQPDLFQTGRSMRFKVKFTF
jgi:hypothetical protein